MGVLGAAWWAADRVLGPPAQPAHAGLVRVIDGDTISLAGQRIRLEGLDAPELAQACTRDGVTWPCGRDAALALNQRLQGRTVTCIVSGQDRFDRNLARCHDAGGDIGAWLVQEGLAVAATRYSWRYLPEEIAARWHGRGLWAGSFDRPEDWRRANPR
jgi:endonuclease YncB( thermonuclease family)